jgi:hypothetical protein
MARLARGPRQVNRPCRQEVYRGLLYALRAHRSTFDSYGESFHAAFEEALQAAEKHSVLGPIARGLLEERDNLFGVYPGAEEMVLDGMVALLLTLDAPRLTRARFSISQRQAEKELAEFPHVDVYRKMAQAFVARTRRNSLGITT